MDDLNIAVCIPHLHKGQTSYWSLKQCLKSLQKFEPSLLRHTIIIDDASTDPMKYEHLQNIQNKFGSHVVWKKKQTSYASLINTGLKLSYENKYDVMICLNNDIELKTPFIKKMNEVFKHEDIGILGCFLMYPDGRVQHEGIEVRGHDKFINMYNYGKFERCNSSGPSMAVTGAFQAIHLERCKIYNESYSLSYEDVEYCLRHWEKGIATWYEDSIMAIHYESATRSKVLGPREFQSLVKFKEDKFDFSKIEKNIDHFIKASAPKTLFI